MASSELTKFLKQQHILDLIDDENFTEVYKLCKSNREIISELTRFLLDCNIKPDNYMSTIPARYLYKSPEITTYDISDSVTSIGAAAFSHCSSLTSIAIPDSVTSIGDFAFEDCTSLTSATIGDGVMYIEHKMFRNCTSLTSITIPDSVTHIGYEAFYGCSSLTNINFRGTNAQWEAIAKANKWDENTGEYTLNYIK